MSLITITVAKEFLRIGHSVEQTTLQLALDACEDYIAKHLGLRFNEAAADAAVVENLKGGGINLWPNFHPILTLTSVVDRETNAAESTSIVRFNESRIWKMGEAAWLSGIDRWIATYTAGYTATTMPPGLKLEILQLMYRGYYKRGGVKEVESMDLDIEWEELMDSDVERRLFKYSFRRKFM